MFLWQRSSFSPHESESMVFKILGLLTAIDKLLTGLVDSMHRT